MIPVGPSSSGSSGSSRSSRPEPVLAPEVAVPREIVVVAPARLDLRRLVEAGAAVRPGLGVRTLDDGDVVQLCRVEAAADEAVLSVHPAVELADPREVSRLLPGAEAASSVAAWNGPVWWLDALAPWGADDDGVLVLRELARQVGGVCVVQDGT